MRTVTLNQSDAPTQGYRLGAAKHHHYVGTICIAAQTAVSDANIQKGEGVVALTVLPAVPLAF